MLFETLSTVPALIKVASLRAVGLCFDEVAVNAKMLQDLEPRRKAPAVLKVMGGSLAIKMLVIPVALAVNAFMPGAILPLLMVGGVHLACEGFRHLQGKYDSHAAPAGGDQADKQKNAKEFEKDRVKKVLTIDGLLSVEITVMTLGVIAGLPALAAAATLAGAGLVRTAWMYGVIGGILSMPSVGAWLSRREGKSLPVKAARGLGKAMMKAMPYVVKGFSIAGTAALLMIGGGLLLHGIPGAEHAIAGAFGAMTPNAMAVGVLERVVSTAVGLVVGFGGAPIMDTIGTAIGKGFSSAKKLATNFFKKKPKPTNDNKVSAPATAPVQLEPASPDALKDVPDVKAALNAAAKPADTNPPAASNPPPLQPPQNDNKSPKDHPKFGT